MDFIKIVIHRNAAKCNKARLRAQPDLKNLFKGDWGKSPQRAKLYKSTLLANFVSNSRQKWLSRKNCYLEQSHKHYISNNINSKVFEITYYSSDGIYPPELLHSYKISR